MSRDEISAATHGDLRLHNPLDPTRLDEVIWRIPLQPGDRALDIGCGPGELLLLLHARKGVGGVGTDSSPVQIAAARARTPEAPASSGSSATRRSTARPGSP